VLLSIYSWMFTIPSDEPYKKHSTLFEGGLAISDVCALPQQW